MNNYYISKNNLDFYKKNGWVKIENFCTVKEIKNLKKNINFFLKKNYKNYTGRDINFATSKTRDWKKINSFHKMEDCKYVKNFTKRKKINNLVRNFIVSKKVKLKASELFAKPKDVGLEVPLHQDNFYWCVKNSKALTMWIALENSSKENGGVFYYNRSHELGLLPHKASYKKGSSQMLASKKKLKKLKKIIPSLKIGDCLLHHCLIVHGSNKNKSKMSRKGLTFQYYDKNSRIDYKRKKKYEDSLKKQIKIRSWN